MQFDNIDNNIIDTEPNKTYFKRFAFMVRDTLLIYAAALIITIVLVIFIS